MQPTRQQLPGVDQLTGIAGQARSLQPYLQTAIAQGLEQLSGAAEGHPADIYLRDSRHPEPLGQYLANVATALMLLIGDRVQVDSRIGYRQRCK